MQEYCITYTLTSQANTSTGNRDFSVARSRFRVAGDTDVNIGQITRIVFSRKHFAVGSGVWKLQGRLNFSGRSTINSDTVSHSINGNYVTYANTFSSDLPTAAEWADWTSVTVHVVSSGDGTLYWRANSSQPMRIYVYFYRAEDLIVDAAPPVVSGVGVADSKGYKSTFGEVVQRMSDLVVTGYYSLDSRYPTLTARHTLVLTDEDGDTIYSATQDSAVFAVGAIDASGQIGWRYSVVDGTGGTGSANGYMTVLSYAAPSMAGLSVQRYISSMDDQGHTIYEADETGEKVWFTFTASAAQVASKNAWTLSLTYGQEGSSSGTTAQIASRSDGATLSYTNDRTVLTAAISAGSGWWFTVKAVDAFGQSASMTAYITESGALLDVEANGVGIGMRVKNGGLEVDNTWPARLNGGIEALEMHWEALTLSSGTGSLEIGRAGSHVYIRGEVTAASGATLVAALPFTPRANAQRLAACGGSRIARLSANANGTLMVDWVLRIADGATETTAVWICCNMDYWV